MQSSKFRTPFVVLVVLVAALAALSSQFASGQGSGPKLRGASVTIPYAELRRLWEAAHPPAAPAATSPAFPIEAVLRTASYEVQLDPGESGGSAVVAAKFEAANLSGKWQFVPLVGGRVQIESIVPADAQVVRRDGVYGILLAPESQAEIGLRLNAGSSAAGIELTTAAATIGKLSVAGIPADRSIEVEGALETGGSDEQRRMFSLPAESVTLAIKLVPKIAEPLAARRDLPPSQWEISGEIVAQFADAALRFESKLHLHADAGAGDAATLIFPAGSRIHTATGDDLGDWRATRSEDGSRQLKLRWKSREALDREVRVAWDVAQSPLAATWTLAPPAVAPDAGVEARFLFAIRSLPGLELRGADGQLPGAPQQLPTWSAGQIGAAEYITVAAVADPVILNARWLPRVATAEAMVSAASFEQNLVGQGAILTQAKYTIDHQVPTRFVVELPELGEILTCKVAGQAVRPVQRGQNQLEFSLPAAADGAQTEVEFCYAAQLAALDPVSGSVELELPRTELFIHRLGWQIEIPARFETTAAEGNVTIAETAEPKPYHLQLEKRLCRGERPAVALHYQRTQ